MDVSDRTGGRAPAVELHIEELVLHGFPAEQRYRIADAFQRELTDRIAARGAVHRPDDARLDLARLDGGEFTARAGAPAEALGADIARAVHGALRTARPSGRHR